MSDRLSIVRTLTASVVAVVGSSLLLTGCGSTGAATAAPAVMTLHASEAEDLSSIEEVAASSSAAVFFTAGQSRTEVVANLPFTVTTVTVTKSAEGALPAGTSLEIRQTGEVGKVVVDGDPEILVSGAAYAGFVEPFHFAEGDDTGQWIITGDGLWKDLAGAELQITSEETTLPAEVTDAEFVEAAAE